jgi:Ankyrin repeats (many copies)
VSDEVETEWLHAAICKGSSTARRRLASLNSKAYTKAVDELKRCHAGVGVNYRADTTMHISGRMTTSSQCSKTRRIRLVNIFNWPATSGRLALLHNILERYRENIDINARYPGDETALLKACRSSHFEAVLSLLDHDADASICSEDGATPLHFLSAFEDDQIPIIAKKLLEAKANLSARSHNAHIYRSAVDPIFGMVDGTPLAWAVAANNKVATRALLEFGASPFDIAGRTVKYGDGWSNNSHTSPVWRAAVSFQYDLLEMLLKKAKDCSVHLNYAARTFGTQSLRDPFTVLGWVVSGGTNHSLQTLLLHGRQFSHAFQQTFDILLQRGADPFNVDTSGNPVIRPAIPWCQPYILNHLMTTRGGRLKPDTPEWTHSILIAFTLQDNPMLRVLLSHSQADKLSGEDWNRFFATTEALPDDAETLNHFLKYRDPNADLFINFGNALRAGKYELAKWLFQSGKCDVTTVTHNKSLLGRLIIASKLYRNAGQHIAKLLSLNPPDAIYHNVMDTLGSNLTALQAAVYIQEYRQGHSDTNDVLQAILRKKD